MQKSVLKNVKSAEIVSISFALVVLISLFSSFSARQSANPLEIVALIFLGITYITNGIYGYQITVRSEKFLDRIFYFVLQLLIGSLIFYFEKTTSLNVLIFLPLVAQTVLLFSGYWLLAANVISLLTFLVVAFISHIPAQTIWTNILSFLAGQLFVIIFTQAIADEENARLKVENMANELMQANKQLRDYASKVEELTLIKERNRLAREIHDGLGHSLTTINMQIKASQAVMEKNPEKAKEMLGSAQQITRDALEEVRDSIFAIRTSSESPVTLEDQLKKLIAHSEPSGICSKFKLVGRTHELSPKIEYTLYRTAQESLNNILKHSKASHLWVTLDYSLPKTTSLCIRDDGVGAERLKEGYGMKGLRERVNLVGGKISFQTSQGKGLIVNIEVPE
jgi:signal transduction histidine kinase